MRPTGLCARWTRAGAQEYRYDAAGNLLQQPGLSGVVLREGNRLTEANGDYFECNARDAIGLRRGRGGETRYVYDSRDMLIRVETDAGDIWQAQYDPLGRLTSKSHGGRRIDYYWDTDRLAAEVHGDGRVRIYVYADPFALVPLSFLDYEGLDAEPASGRRYGVFGDQIGAPVRIEDESGAVVWAARIEPYGRAHVAPEASIQYDLRFPGHFHDPGTGLHYNRFRSYSPELGRYLQPDPIGIAGGLNLYAYPTSPLTKVDVRGLSCTEHGDTPDADCLDCQNAEKARLAAEAARRAAEKAERKANAYHGPKPPYENPGHHDPSSPNFRGGGSMTSVIPPNHEQLFSRAIPEPDGRTWWAKDESGNYHRFQGSTGGPVHWNGRSDSPRGAAPPTYIRRRFGDR